MLYIRSITDHFEGLFLTASVEDQNLQDIQDLKQQVRQILKKMTSNTEPRASIESKKYTIQYENHLNPLSTPPLEPPTYR